MTGFRRSWGADPAGDGRWEFRLWAPALDRMGLLLDGREHAMERDAEGWFRAELSADPGAEYRFAPPGGPHVPDPAARAQAGDVHGASVLVDPDAYQWQTAWAGRPWHETVLYELHVGTFSKAGTFDGVRRHLDHLADLGVTAIELCPVAQFAGTRGWGYDGVLHYAPHVAYGGPEGLKRLVDAAHERGLMAFLDVVYNHFGPDGNYLNAYAPEFFHEERHTPWGAAIAYDLAPVRNFFIENALYWLDEYRFDGLRLDAVDQIEDQSEEPLLAEIATAVRDHPFGRPVHLTTEDDRNVTRFHERAPDGSPKLYDGEWNDDWHHVAHVLATHESEGYYFDYSQDARNDMAIALRDGYVQQGRHSPFRHGARRGEPSAHLPPTAFVNFLQNHDQTGNRAFGERLTTMAEPEEIRDADGAAAALAADPAAVHGRGMGRDAAIPVLHRLPRRAGRRRPRGPPARVRPLAEIRRPRAARAHPGPERPGDLRAVQARLERARDAGRRPAPPPRAPAPRDPRPRDRAAPRRHRRQRGRGRGARRQRAGGALADGRWQHAPHPRQPRRPAL